MEMFYKQSRTYGPGDKASRRTAGMFFRLVALPIFASTCYASVLGAKELNTSQISLIRETVTNICNTVSGAKGLKTEAQIAGDVKAQLGGLAGKLATAGLEGQTSIRRDAFEGLSQEATAEALQGDRLCRERLFVIMFDTTNREINNIPHNIVNKPQLNEPSARDSFVGEWVGTVICQNDKNFLITLDIKKQNGDTASGTADWRGHLSGGAGFRLVPDPSLKGTPSYIYIPNIPDVYSYKFTRINKDKLVGQSTGSEKCDIILER
ncbi:hypothetical protein [Methylobacterium sp. SyP6R]|uniref:hypothetical protein n=1 Tax=Methylobacterium sp. SyP6R TaxID=2718876 RepID=UPI001F2A74F3|nr:hypothetical protein [Methylobacterium sp. SyP6R]MCF4123797.1 hypothetical protein [Methylobacterium sp. SyP6R]